MLLNILPYTGRPSRQRIIWSKMLMVPRLKILIWRVERIYWQWEGVPAGIRKSWYKLGLDGIGGCPEVPSSLHPSGCKFLIHLPDFRTSWQFRRLIQFLCCSYERWIKQSRFSGDLQAHECNISLEPQLEETPEVSGVRQGRDLSTIRRCRLVCWELTPELYFFNQKFYWLIDLTAQHGIWS